MNNNDNGFTLVELVVVIIVLTVLAASAIPRLTLTQGYAATTDRDQLIALLISVQTRAMQNTDGDCYAVSFLTNPADSTEQQVGMLAQRADGSCDTRFLTNSDAVDGFLQMQMTNVASAINASNSTITRIDFDNLGRPVNSSGSFLGRIRVSIANEALCIEREGYIHVCP